MNTKLNQIAGHRSIKQKKVDFSLEFVQLSFADVFNYKALATI